MALLVSAGCAVASSEAVVSTQSQPGGSDRASSSQQEGLRSAPDPATPTPQVIDLNGWQDLPRHATSAVVVPVGIEVVAPRSGPDEPERLPEPGRAELGFSVPEPTSPEAPAPEQVAPSTEATPSTSTEVASTRERPERPAPSSENVVAVAPAEVDFIPVHRSPGGPVYDLKYEFLDGSVTDYPLVNPTYFGGPLTLAVVSGSIGDEWLEVQLPVRPTGSTAWVRAELFDLTASEWYVEIDVGTNQVRAWRGDDLLIESAAVSGRSSRPTPVVSTYIDDKVAGPNSAYGPWMLTLAAFSESLNRFGGGIPKLAIHGTDSPGLMGQYASSGCVRVPNAVIEELATLVPVGTRVDIVSSR